MPTVVGLLGRMGQQPRESADPSVLKDLYHRASRLHHPDSGGTERGQKMVNAAYRESNVHLLQMLIKAGERLRTG